MPKTNGRQAATTVFLESLEQNATLGRVAEAVGPSVDAVLGSGPVSDALRGRSIGHALHPLLVQVPLGALLSASVLDLLHGKRAAGQSRLLMGVVVLSAVPSVASGLAEWTRADERTQRVGVAHAAANAVGTIASAASYLVRRRGWSPTAAVLTGLAGAAYGVGGLLGGHLSLVRKYASHDRPSDLEGTQRGQYS